MQVRYYTQQTHTDPHGFAQALILGHLYVGASSQLSLDIGVAVERNESKSHLRMKIERIVHMCEHQQDLILHSKFETEE